MSRIETEFSKKLKIKKKQQAAFRRFLRGKATPWAVRTYIGMNLGEIKEYLEERMLDTMNWNNYGTHWVIDHLAPFWLFDLEDEKDLKLLWNPQNLMPMVWKDNNHKQGDLRFSITMLSLVKGSFLVEQLIERCEKELKHQDKYIKLWKMVY